jgi:hypothetical protein
LCYYTVGLVMLDMGEKKGTGRRTIVLANDMIYVGSDRDECRQAMLGYRCPIVRL